MISSVLDSFRVEFAPRFSSLQPDQLEEFEEFADAIPERELEFLASDLRFREDKKARELVLI